jgi:hypothetical protein
MKTGWMLRRALLSCCAVFFCGCNTAPPVTESPTPTVASAKPAVRATADHFGGQISAPEVTLADVAKDPTKFASQPFATRGTVTAVCQEMGCWMEIKDGGSGAHLRMHGHSFFVPKTASGRSARVQATLVPEGAPKPCGGEPSCAGTGLAQLQLEATGVELD